MAARRWGGHYLRPNHRTWTPRVVVFVDTESRREALRHARPAWRHTFRLGHAQAFGLVRGQPVWRRSADLARPDDFWQFLGSVLPRRGAAWVYAHNLAFDFTLVDGWGLCERKAMSLRSAVLSDPPTVLDCRLAGRPVRFVDSLNYWFVPLAELGRCAGLHKSPMPPLCAPDGDWLTYCRRDVDVLAGAVLSALARWEAEDLGNWSPTGAGLAWSAFRHRFMTERIAVHEHPEVKQLERDAYYAGRCDSLFVGAVAEPVAHYDANSLYPWCAARTLLPCRLAGVAESLDPSRIAVADARQGFVARVLLDGVSHPLPFRSPHASGFGVGAFVTTLAGPELRAACQRGWVRRVGHCAVYEMGLPLTGYVEHWYARKLSARLAGDRAGEAFAKLLLNGLVGKFAQRQTRWIDRPDVQAPNPWGTFPVAGRGGGDDGFYRSVGWLAQRRVPAGDAENAFVALPAFVNSAARVRLQGWLDAAGDRQCYYCDTDSLHVSPEGERRLLAGGHVRPNQLGSLRLVARADSARYYGPRNYDFGGKIVCAGLKERARPVGDDTFIQENWDGAERITQGGGRPEVIVRERPFRRFADVTRGAPGPDGWTEPFNVEESIRGGHKEYVEPVPSVRLRRLEALRHQLATRQGRVGESPLPEVLGKAKKDRPGQGEAT